MEPATWVLVAVTSAYVILTAWLVQVDRRRLRRESNPVVYPRVHYATVQWHRDTECCYFHIRAAACVLARAPALNVVVEAQLKVIAPRQRELNKFHGATIPVLTPDDRPQVEEITWPLPELGRLGIDNVELPLFLHVAAEYSNVLDEGHFGLFVASPFSVRTPGNEGESRGVDVRAGVFYSRESPHSRVGRWWFRRRSSGFKS